MYKVRVKCKLSEDNNKNNNINDNNKYKVYIGSPGGLIKIGTPGISIL